MALLGLLGQNQNTQNQEILTQQQQAQMQQVATMLQQQGQNKENQKFTSPWQVAGQWAQALGGQSMQKQLGQGYQQLNQSIAPSVPGGAGGAVPSADSLPWSGAGAGADAGAADIGAGAAAGGDALAGGVADLGAGAGGLGLLALA